LDFSVIVPSFNSAKYLPDLFHSIFGGETSIGVLKAQTILPYEIIVVDDASQDNTEEVVDSFRSKFPRISYYRLNRNSGTPVACNVAVRNSSTEIITRIDSDDMREFESFERMLSIQRSNPNSFVFDDIKIFVNGKRQVHAWIMPEYDFFGLLRQNTIHAGIMFPKSAWEKCGGYPEEFVRGRDDWSFNVALGSVGCCGIHVPYAGYLYRREQQNRTLRNSSSEAQRDFMFQMTKRFPDLYSGRFPMGCCGNRGSRTATSKPSGSSSELVVGEEGMTILEYQGGNYGTETFYGPVTRTPYRFNSTKYSKRNVDNRDLHAPKGQGLLDFHNGSKPIFVIWRPSEPVVQVNDVPEVPDISKTVEVPETADATSSEVNEAVMTFPIRTPIESGQVKGITVKRIKALSDRGISDWESFVSSSSELLSEITGMSVEDINAIKKDLTE